MLLPAPWRGQPAIAGEMDRPPVFAFGRARITISAMCGRFIQNLSWAEIHRLADLIGQPRNLELQTWDEAGEKDRIETCLSRAVCAGTITLDEARRLVWQDWRVAGKACQ